MAARLRDLIADDLREALRARDRLRVAVLRTAAAAIANAEAVPLGGDGSDGGDGDGVGAPWTASDVTEVARRELSGLDERRIVEAERDEALAGAAELSALGAGERADELRAHAAILDDLLARAAAASTPKLG